jgi:hypothetical protein
MTRDLARTQLSLATELGQDTAAGARSLPGTLAHVVHVAELTDGVRLGELIAALQPDREAADAALAQILRDAAKLHVGTGLPAHLKQWESVIAAVATASRDQELAARLRPHMQELASAREWAALASVLRRILDGERSKDLLKGLDGDSAAIAREILNRLSDSKQEPPRQ